jgi:hypothetical protein
MHSVTIVVCSLEFDLLPLSKVTAVITVTKITMVINVAWRFPTQSLRRAEPRVGSHVKCLLLLPKFNKNWNVSTNFSKTLKYKS